MSTASSLDLARAEAHAKVAALIADLQALDGQIDTMSEVVSTTLNVVLTTASKYFESTWAPDGTAPLEAAAPDVKVDPLLTETITAAVVKTAATKQRWIAHNQFVDEVKDGAKLCAFVAPRGPHRGRICGAPADKPGAKTEDWRCSACMMHISAKLPLPGPTK